VQVILHTIIAKAFWGSFLNIHSIWDSSMLHYRCSIFFNTRRKDKHNPILWPNITAGYSGGFAILLCSNQPSLAAEKQATLESKGKLVMCILKVLDP